MGATTAASPTHAAQAALAGHRVDADLDAGEGFRRLAHAPDHESDELTADTSRESSIAYRPVRYRKSAEQPEGADDDPRDADQRADNGPSLNEHCAVDSGFQPGDLGPQLGDAGVELLRRDMLAVLGGLADGISQRVSVASVDPGVGQLPGDCE